MNDLQMVLIVIGGMIIAAVLVFNWWQERRFHQQVEKNFSNIKSDALLDDPLSNETLSANPAPVEPSLGNSDLYDAAEHIEQDDFSIDHDSIRATSITDEEPTIKIPASLDENTSFPEPALAEVPAINDVTAVEQSIDGNASAELNNPFTEAEVKPVNHEGIKAIFEDAFNKNLNKAGLQEDETIKEPGQADAVRPEISAPSLPVMLHAQIDLIALLHLTAEMTVAEVAKALKNDFDAYDKPVFIHVQTPDLRWLLLNEIASKPEFADQKISKITCSLQLADRAGPVPRNVVNRFQLAVESLGLDINANVEWQSSGDAAADAVALDAFCIDVDKTMGFHLVHGDNGAFTGTKLRGMAEAQGLELAADGTFKYYDEAVKKQATGNSNPQMPSFVMFNREHYPFSPDMLRSSVVKGITFQLDIPHVSNCTEAYNHMVLVAKQMENGLHAQLVDDNNRPLGDAQIEKIRHQLKIIQATMLTRGIIPGSDVAHRLFS